MVKPGGAAAAVLKPTVGPSALFVPSRAPSLPALDAAAESRLLQRLLARAARRTAPIPPGPPTPALLPTAELPRQNGGRHPPDAAKRPFWPGPRARRSTNTPPQTATLAHRQCLVEILDAAAALPADAKPSQFVDALARAADLVRIMPEFHQDRRFADLVKQVHYFQVQKCQAAGLVGVAEAYCAAGLTALKLWKTVLRQGGRQMKACLFAKAPRRYVTVRSPDLVRILTLMAKAGIRPYRQVALTLSHIARGTQELRPAELASLLRCMRRLRMRPVDPKNALHARQHRLLSLVAARAAREHRKVPLRHLASIAKDCVALGFLPPLLVDRVMRLVVLSGRKSVAALADAAYVFRKIGVWDMRVEAHIARRATSVLRHAAAGTLPDGARKAQLRLTQALSLVCALALKTRERKPVARALIDLGKSLQTATEGDHVLAALPGGRIPDVAFAGALLGLSDGLFWNGVLAAAKLRVAELHHGQLSTVVRAAAVASDSYDAALLEDLLREMVEVAPRASFPSLLRCAESLCFLLSRFHGTRPAAEELLAVLLEDLVRHYPQNILPSEDTQLHRFAIALTLVLPDIVERLPAASKLVVARHQRSVVPVVPVLPSRVREIFQNCIGAVAAVKRFDEWRGPLRFDGVLECPRGGNRTFAVDLVNSQYYDSLTKAELPPLRLRRQMAAALDVVYVPVPRVQWCKLPGDGLRTSHLRKALCRASSLNAQPNDRIPAEPLSIN